MLYLRFFSVSFSCFFSGFFCFRFFLFSLFSVFVFFRNSFCSNVTSLFFGRPLLFRLFFRFLSCDSIFVLFCFVSRYSAITVFSSGALSRLVRDERMAAPPYATTGSYLDNASLVKFGPVGSLFFSFARDPFSIALAGKAGP